MCGIAGCVTDGAPVSATTLTAMLDTLRHRGPDGAGMYCEGPVGLGMRRLAIIDPPGGDQPLYSEDRSIVLVGNGEIYGFAAQRAELRARGHRFSGGSDLEVALHLYEEHGDGFLDHLRGMFALALWDDRRRRLLLARDRLGEKPLLWAMPRPGTLVFGSEPAALLADPAVPRDLDCAAIDACLSLQHVPPDRSAFAALHPVAPGAMVVWSPGEVPRQRHWWRAPAPTPRRVRLSDAGQELRELLLEATELRLVSDVPVGAFLSGGLDSSAVVAAMARRSRDPVRTFSARFEDPALDEGAWARRVAEHLGSEHRELHVGPVDAGTLYALVGHLGEPLADPAAVPAYLLAQLAREHVTVVLTGDGGDELLSGYRRHHQMAWTRPADVVPAVARRGLARAAAPLGGRPARLAGRLAMTPPERYADLMRHFHAADREDLYGERLRHLLDDGRPLGVIEDAWERGEGLNVTERVLGVDRDVYLAGALLPKADLTSMAHGLELRPPLLDHHLVDWAATLPSHLKRRRATGKRVLRAAMAPWLPADVIDRPKQGFGVPVSAWLRGPLRELASDVLPGGRACAEGLLDERALRARLARHDGGEDHGAVLWSALVLELWLRVCVGGSAPAVGARAA